LKAESSFNQGFGLVYEPNKRFSIAMDGYVVEVRDRIVLTGAFFDTDDKIGAELKALKVKAAQFYVNALDTRSIGLDISAQYRLPLEEGYFQVSASANVNKMVATKVYTPISLQGKEDKVVSPRELQYILSSAPRGKSHLTAQFKQRKWQLMLRLNYFSGLSLIGTNGTLGFDPMLDNMYSSNKSEWLKYVLKTYQPRLVPDVSVHYDLTPQYRLTVGGNNILDVYPTIQDSGTTDGGAMWDGVQMGYGGAYFFGRLTLKL
jgi:iron complex outermembrane recepter protein